MIALKIIGIVIGALILLIGAICIIPVSFRLTSKADERLGYKLYVLGIPINLEKLIKKREGNSTTPENEKGEGDKVKSKPSLDELADIVKALAKQFFWLLKRFKICKLHILSISAGEDAAEIAMQYGAICAVLYPVTAIIESNMRIKKNAADISVLCDFEQNEPVFELDIKVSVKVFYLLQAGLSALTDIVKQRAEKEITK